MAVAAAGASGFDQKDRRIYLEGGDMLFVHVFSRAELYHLDPNKYILCRLGGRQVHFALTADDMAVPQQLGLLATSRPMNHTPFVDAELEFPFNLRQSCVCLYSLQT